MCIRDRSYYEELLLAGVRIFEYTPGFIHAKVFTSDDTKAVVGSINLDYRSLHLHFESVSYTHLDVYKRQGPEKTVYVEGIDITGMTMDEARSAILDKFGWSMKVTWQDQTYEVADLMEEKVSALLTEIYSGMLKESYTLDTSGLEDAAKSEAAKAAAQWDKKAKNGSISSYDASSGKFVFSGEEAGQAVEDVYKRQL